MKFAFAPVGIIAGLIAGLLAKKGFEKAWAVIDDEEPPEPDQRGVPTGKLIAALAIEGAIFRVVKGIVDHQARYEVRRRHRPLARQGPGQRRRLARSQKTSHSEEGATHPKEKAPLWEGGTPLGTAGGEHLLTRAPTLKPGSRKNREIGPGEPIR